MARQKPMTDEQLVALAQSQFADAMGIPGGDISMERARAYDYYLGKPFGNEVEGRSQVVTSDVADVVDGIMPSLLRIFTTSDNLVNFDPVGPEDMERAQQESDYVNHVFFKENDSFTILHTWFMDALLQKNGIVKSWWDEPEKVERESYQNLTETELADVLDDSEDGVKIKIIEQEERESTVTVTVQTPEGAIDREVEGTVHDVVIERRSTQGCVKVAPVAPERFRISQDALGGDPSHARMVGENREVTRSELLEMGFDADTVEMLPSTGDIELQTPEGVARQDKTDDVQQSDRDRSQDPIELHEIYTKVDADGDGRSELRQLFIAGSELLSNEIVDRQPYHSITPVPLPHKFFGRSYADKVMDLQEVNSTLTRQILDNLYHTNNPGHAVWEQGIGENTLSDLLTSHIGQVKRFARPPAESYQPITVPFAAGSAMPMLEVIQSAKRDRTGVNNDGEGLNPEQLKNIQTSVLSQANDISRMKIEAVARIFAETGIKTLFLHIHELLLKHQRKERIVRLRNQWVPVDPTHWRTRMDMTVNVGLGIGTREQNLMHLDAIWQKQSEIAQNGGMQAGLLTPENIYNTASEIVKNANFKQPEMFFTNPGPQTQQSQEDGGGEQEALAQVQLQIAQMEQQTDQLRAQLQAQNNEAKNQLEAQKNESRNQIEMLKIELEREKARAGQANDAAKLRQGQTAEENKVMIELEKIATQLTELELQQGQNVPGSRV